MTLGRLTHSGGESGRLARFEISLEIKGMLDDDL